MNVGFGFSKQRDAEAALQEAYRKSLQKIGATKSDLSFVFYSYDYGLDLVALSGVFKRVLRYVPHIGCSTWAAWSSKENFEAETGLMVVSFKNPSFEFELMKVHSLREKSELWSAEIGRQLSDKELQPDQVFILADSLNFSAGNGFSFLEKHFPQTQFTGLGTSFTVPQCSVVCDGDVYMNSLVAIAIKGMQPWIGISQNIHPELQPISINRMSENLIIEMDQKPAFYKLCEHLMAVDDLPMMSPDDFRKHMGNLFIIEKPRGLGIQSRTVGEIYRPIPLLGSEMTTGMVAVGTALDFNHEHYLGQKKPQYAEKDFEKVLEELKTKISQPSLLIQLTSASRLRDRERKRSDLAILQSIFPDTPVLGLATNGEFLRGVNQYASIVIAWE